MALAILLERKGSMYDPLVIDTFLAVYRDIMPREVEASEPARPEVPDVASPIGVIDRSLRRRRPARTRKTSWP